VISGVTLREFYRSLKEGFVISSKLQQYRSQRDTFLLSVDAAVEAAKKLQLISLIYYIYKYLNYSLLTKLHC
jgi:hypothetical protein